MNIALVILTCFAKLIDVLPDVVAQYRDDAVARPDGARH